MSEATPKGTLYFWRAPTWAEIEPAEARSGRGRGREEGVGRLSGTDRIQFANRGLPAQFPPMSTVQEIKSAIEQLSFESRAELIADLCGWSDDDWDRQMKADAAAGKFSALNEDADRANGAVQASPLSEGLDRS